MGQNATDAHVSPLTLPTGQLPAVRPFGLGFERLDEARDLLPATPATPAGHRNIPESVVAESVVAVPVVAEAAVQGPVVPEHVVPEPAVRQAAPTDAPPRRRGRHFADPAPADMAAVVPASPADRTAVPSRPVFGERRTPARTTLPDAGWWARLVRAPLTPQEAEVACRYRVALVYDTDGERLVLRSVHAATGEASVHLAEPDGSCEYHLSVRQVPGGVRVTRCSQVPARPGQGR